MELKQISVLARQWFHFSLAEVGPTSPYILKSAIGLGPTDIDLAFTRVMDRGQIYHGRQMVPRQIVLRLLLNPNYEVGETPATLRQNLFSFLAPGPSDKLRIELFDENYLTGTPWAFTEGYVSKFEDNPFSRDPEVQITIDCTTAYFQAPSELTATMTGSLAIPGVVNAGTAPAGFEFRVKMTADKSMWRLTSSDFNSRMQFDYAFQNNDELLVNTTPGLRSIYVIRAGTTYNKIDILSDNSTWFMLYGGNNGWFASDSNYQWVHFKYRPQYLGV